MEGKGIAISSSEALELKKLGTQVSLFSNEFRINFVFIYIYIYMRDFENCIMFLTFDHLPSLLITVSKKAVYNE
jgi:hypothetical protein